MIHRKCILLRKSLLLVVASAASALSHAMCPTITPWSAPVNLSQSGNLTSNVFSAATSAGFMTVWADSSNNGHYSFSADGLTWSSGLITTATDVLATSDVFVAGNDTGFMVTWIDSSNNGWSSFSADNGNNWSVANQINGGLALDSNTDVYVAGGSTGFVATMLVPNTGTGNDDAYVSFSTGTAAWSIPVAVTTDGSVSRYQTNSASTGRGFVSVAISGNSCMLAWLNVSQAIYSAYFTSINPFSSTTVYPIVNIGFFYSVPILAQANGYFMAVALVAGSPDLTYFIVTANPPNTNWGVFTFTPNNFSTTGPWVAANQTGFISTWPDNSTPVWTLSENNGFNWTPVCSILDPVSTAIGGFIGLSANSHGFVASWFDSNDSNAYASFYVTPATTSPAGSLFVTLLQQKYGPLLNEPV